MKSFNINYFLLVIFCLGITKVFGQMPQGFENMTNLGFEAPNINPASPSVAAMMRFEEIPVNGYTGIPDINIPLFSSPTLSDKVKLDISLNYHASSIGVDEIAPVTGLGWSLMAGGSISKTVRGSVDEKIQNGGPSRGDKIGIYNRTSNVNSISHNFYYQAESWSYNSELEEALQQFKWNGYEKGMYDTEHDLYQFNFMGISGRFYLRLNSQNNLDVIRLDDNTQYKIEVDYTGPFFDMESIFSFNKFTITDPNGIKYIFQDKEELSSSSSSTFIIYFDDNAVSSNNHGVNYVSAYHLTEIRDEYNQALVEFNYIDVDEKTVMWQQTRNTLRFYNTIYEWAGDDSPYNQDFSFNISKTEPKFSTTTTQNEYKTKKLSSIVIHGIGRLDFFYSGGRTDTNLPSDNGAKKLDYILITNNKDKLIKRFELDYQNFRINGYTPKNIHQAPNYLERLVLTGVREFGSDPLNTVSLNYKLEYDKPYPNETNIFKNPWGYFESNSSGVDAKKFATTGVLKKMHLPTGGYIQFDFEPSTYSYIGDKKITDFSGNPENTSIPGASQTFYYDPMELASAVNSPLILTVLDNTAYDFVKFELYLDWQKYPTEGYSLHLKSTNGLSIPLSPTDVMVEVNADDALYSLEMENENIPSNGGPDFTIKVQPFVVAYGPPTVIGGKEYLYGGGIRIKDIKFFEKGELDNPITLKRYEYREFEDTDENTSSGSIPFGEPVYEFLFEKKTPKSVNGTIGASSLSYTSKTDFNNLAFLKTQGADVGYKYVRILDVDPADPSKSKGKTENIYVSPIDYPEYDDSEWDIEDYAISYPFIPSRNFDYRRGQLENSKIFNENGKLIKETTNKYEFANDSINVSGLRLTILNGGGCAYAYEFKSYSFYKARYNACQTGTGSDCERLCDFPASHIQSHRIEEAIGRAQLTKTITQEYFYEGSNESIVETVQDFTYNEVNKQVQSQQIQNSLGEILKAEYRYPQDLVTAYEQSGLMQDLVAQNRISEAVITKTYNNSTVTAEKRVLYDSNELLPHSVYVKKGAMGSSAALEDRKITYDRYNDYGNLEQYTLENGTPVSIVWGYNGQYPIVKVEGKTYNEIESWATSLIQSSNNNSLTPSSFDFLITTPLVFTGYVYEPLVGITAIVQSNGIKELYEYDTFGRLKTIKDGTGNILKSVDYHYKNPEP